MAPSGWVSEALVSQSGWSCSALCEYKPPALGQPQYPPKQTHTLRGQAEQSFHDPFSNKTRLWLSFWQERKKGGILLRHAQWEGFSKGTSEGPTRWTLGLHLRLSHISFPSSPPSFPLPSTRFTSSLLVYKVAVQSARAVMEAHTRTQEHRGWHSARAGCCRKGPLRQQPGCKAHSMKVSLLQSTSTLSNLQAAPQTRLTSVPYTQLFQSHFRHEVGAKRPCTICWHQQAACKTLVQTSQSHHFNATVVVDRKEKGMEGSLCTDCSGIWSWFNEENYSRLLNCYGFLFGWMLVFFYAFQIYIYITIYIW